MMLDQTLHLCSVFTWSETTAGRGSNETASCILQYYRKLGRFCPVFDSVFEGQLTQHCLKMQKTFYGFSVKQCRKLAFDLAEKNRLNHPFSKTEKMLGANWMSCFLKRHPELSLHEAEPKGYKS